MKNESDSIKLPDYHDLDFNECVSYIYEIEGVTVKYSRLAVSLFITAIKDNRIIYYKTMNYNFTNFHKMTKEVKEVIWEKLSANKKDTEVNEK